MIGPPPRRRDPGTPTWWTARLRAGGVAEVRARWSAVARLAPLALSTATAAGRRAWLRGLEVPEGDLPSLARSAAAALGPLLPPVRRGPAGAESSIRPLRDDGVPVPGGRTSGFGPWLGRRERADRGLRRRWEADRWARFRDLPPDLALAHLLAWLDRCPPPAGEPWMDGLEVATRLVNGLLCLARAGRDLDRGPVDPRWSRVVASLRASARLIQRAPAAAPPAMNHRLGEAAALFVFARALPGLSEASAAADSSANDLSREVVRQFDPESGYSHEQSTGYQRWDMEWLDLVVQAAAGARVPPPPGVAGALERGLDTLGRLTDPAGALVPLGDDDGSPLLGRLGVVPAWRRGRVAGAEVLWIGDPEGAVRAALVASPLGAPGLAAHGHADALSVLLWAWGEEVLIDPGTGTYRPSDPLRAWFRSTGAHSTVLVDGRDAAEPGGPFLWTTRYVPEVLEAGPTRAAARHDGYARLKDPVRLSRAATWDAGASCLRVEDRLEARGVHDVEVRWHLPASADVSRHSGGAAVRVGPVLARFRVSAGPPCPTFETRVARGQADPPLGWRSRAYERVEPAPVVVFAARTEGEARWITEIGLERIDEGSTAGP